MVAKEKTTKAKAPAKKAAAKPRVKPSDEDKAQLKADKAQERRIETATQKVKRLSEQIITVTAARNDAIVQARKQGATLRVIGEAADLNHMTVQAIISRRPV